MHDSVGMQVSNTVEDRVDDLNGLKLRVTEVGFSDDRSESLALDIFHDDVDGTFSFVDFNEFDKVGMIMGSHHVDFIVNSRLKIG